MTTKKFYYINVPTLLLEAVKEGPPKIVELVPTEVEVNSYFDHCVMATVFNTRISAAPKHVPEKNVVEYIPTSLTRSDVTNFTLYNRCVDVTEYYNIDNIANAYFDIVQYARKCYYSDYKDYLLYRYSKGYL